MWDFVKSHRPSRSQDWTHWNTDRTVDKPRGSIERQSLIPLTGESGTDERRYYRSAEFQQALLEAKIERELAPPVATPIENTKRQSWHRRLSTIGVLNTRASQSESALPMFDYEVERIRELAEACSGQPPPDVEMHSPAGEAVAPPEHVPDAPRDEYTDGSNSSEQSHQRRRSRPRLRTDGLAPLFSRARNSFSWRQEGLSMIC